jgi:hypothetical protein
MVDPGPKTRVAHGEELGAIVKDALAKSVVSDAACRQPSADAPAFVQHSHPKTLSL